MKKSKLALLGVLISLSISACGSKETPVESTPEITTKSPTTTVVETTEAETTVAPIEVPTDAPVEDLKIQDVSIPDFQAETLEMLKSDWDACRVTQQEVEEVYFADDLMLSEAGKEEMRQYMKDHPQVKETQAPVKETKPVETQAPVKETKPVETKPVETQAPVETQSSTQNSHNPADYGMTAEEMEQLGLEFADDANADLHDDTGIIEGNSLKEGQQDIWK